MANRKSDIFTVVESVTNWFEANEQTVTHSEMDGRTANWSETSHSSAIQFDMAREAAHRSEDSFWVGV